MQPMGSVSELSVERLVASCDKTFDKFVTPDEVHDLIFFRHHSVGIERLNPHWQIEFGRNCRIQAFAATGSARPSQPANDDGIGHALTRPVAGLASTGRHDQFRANSKARAIRSD